MWENHLGDTKDVCEHRTHCFWNCLECSIITDRDISSLTDVYTPISYCCTCKAVFWNQHLRELEFLVLHLTCARYKRQKNTHTHTYTRGKRKKRLDPYARGCSHVSTVVAYRTFNLSRLCCSHLATGWRACAKTKEKRKKVMDVARAATEPKISLESFKISRRVHCHSMQCI